MKKITMVTVLSLLMVSGTYAYNANQINMQESVISADAKERVIDLGSIPLSVSSALREKYSEYRIGLFVTEVQHGKEKYYYVTAEGASGTLILKCYLNGDIVVKKVNRKIEC